MAMLSPRALPTQLAWLAFSALLGCSSTDHAANSGGGGGGNGAGGNSAMAGGGAASHGGNGSGGNGTGGDGTPTGPELALPIEVLGSGAPDDPAIAGTELTLASADTASVASLFVRCHRCGFYEAPEYEALAKPLVKVKASLRIVGASDPSSSDAPWVDITNQNVQVEPMALAHGGINGGMVTLSFALPLDVATRARLALAPQTNRIEFRFNGTDGNSNGFRVLDVQLQDATGKNLTPAAKRWADISLEKAAGQAESAASKAGAQLWTGRNLLVKSPLVPRTIRAACNDCHAKDGRDLQYFNYSDNSVVQRSRFHGLSLEQGQNIAAYLRASLYGAKVPHVAAAAPWNPPFQPGPGLDSKPAVEWSAGAGLDAVLGDGKAFLKGLLGQPLDDSPLVVSAEEIGKVLDATKVLNTRETQVPLQFPDWNAWLPPVHPLDIWTPEAGSDTGLFEVGYNKHNPLLTYQAIETWLEEHKNPNGVYGDWSHLTPSQRNELQGKLGSLGNDSIGFGGGSRGTRVSPDAAVPFGVQLAAPKLAALASADTMAQADLTACAPQVACTPFNTDSFLERADVGLYHWMAIKQWEIVETYGLQDQRAFHGTVDAGSQWQGEGEVRGWPYSWPSVFYIAPHMLYAPTETDKTKREFYFAWENRIVSYYRTNAWYQLQVTLNPGWGGASNGPIDWPYTQGFIQGLADDLNNAKAPAWIAGTHLARYFEVNAKLAQLANTQLPFDAPDPKDPTNIWANKGLQSKADLLFKLSPANFLDPRPDQPSKFRVLDDMAPGAYLVLVNGSIALYNSLYANTLRSQYRICDPTNMQMGTAEQFAGQRFCIDEGKTPLPVDGKGHPYCPYPANDGYTTQQYSAWGLLVSQELGADAALLKTWSDWVAQMWP